MKFLVGTDLCTLSVVKFLRIGIAGFGSYGITGALDGGY